MPPLRTSDVLDEFGHWRREENRTWREIPPGNAAVCGFAAHMHVCRRASCSLALPGLTCCSPRSPRTWCDMEDVVVIGRAYREILKTAAAQEADLIVMGPGARRCGAHAVRIHDAAGRTRRDVSGADRPRLTQDTCAFTSPARRFHADPLRRG